MYKPPSMCVRAAEYLDMGKPFMQESWTTIGGGGGGEGRGETTL